MILIFTSVTVHASPETDRIARLVNELDAHIQAVAKANPQQPQEVKDAIALDSMMGVASEIALLYPEDFNNFLIDAIKLYIQDPSRRPFLGRLWKINRGMLASDYDSQNFQPWQSTVLGVGAIAPLLLLAYSPLKAVLGKAVSPSVANLASDLTKGRFFNKIVMTSERMRNWTIAGASGLTISYAAEFYRVSKTHRIDSQPVFQVIQVNLGCELSYAAMEAIEASEKSKDVKQLKEILDQSRGMLEQNTDLVSIEKSGERMQTAFANLPKSEKWSEFLPSDLRCEEVSLRSVNMRLVRQIVKINPKDQDEKAETPVEPPK